MSCEIKNEKCPFQIQCLFPTTADDTRPFALYFYSPQGSPVRAVACGYNGEDRCLHQEGFEIAHEGFNAVTITVPDAFATSNGSFDCKKGDIPLIKNCLYNPPEICNTISSTESGTGLETATEGISPTILVGVIVGLIIVMAIIIFCWLSKKYRSKSLCRFKKSTISIAVEKWKKFFPGNENTGNHVNQTTTDPASVSFNGSNKETENPTPRNPFASMMAFSHLRANADQEQTSTNTKISGASSGLQLSPSSSVSRTSCSRDTSVTPLLPTV